MALGKKSNDIVDTSNTRNISVNEKVAYGEDAYDAEKGDGGPKARKMSRVGGPIPGIVGDSDVDSQISVGKQCELEQTNSIKYRTCSWQKVHSISYRPQAALLHCAMKFSEKVVFQHYASGWNTHFVGTLSTSFATINMSNRAYRQPHCSLQSTSVSLLCPFHTRIQSSGWSLVSSSPWL